MQGVRWAVAVTTAPRRDCTLGECLQSLRQCGWSPVVFAEPGSTRTDEVTIQNPRRLGTWHNWVQSLRWCLENTDADAILTVQDDALFHPDSKTFAESSMWPRGDCAFLSLYTPRHYSIYKKKFKSDPDLYRRPGVNRIHTKSLWGSLALVWPRHVAEQVIEHPLIQSWQGAAPNRKKSESRESWQARRKAFADKRTADPSLIANSDTAIGKICNRLGKSMWFVDPSPVQHIAQFSSIRGHGGNSGNRNAIRIADHSLPLAFQVLQDANTADLSQQS